MPRTHWGNSARRFTLRRSDIGFLHMALDATCRPNVRISGRVRPYPRASALTFRKSARRPWPDLSRTPSTHRSAAHRIGSVDEGPCFGSVELANRQGAQYGRFKVTQVNSHIVLGAVERLPVRNTAAGLAAKVPQGLARRPTYSTVFSGWPAMRTASRGNRAQRPAVRRQSEQLQEMTACGRFVTSTVTAPQWQLPTYMAGGSPPNVRVERAARGAAGAPQARQWSARLRRARHLPLTDRSNAYVRSRTTYSPQT